MRVASFEEWWTRTLSLAGPLTTMLASLPDDAVARFERAAESSRVPYETPSGLEFPGVSLLASGRRATS